eukprot:154755-Rhodomonas_salina.1
MARNLNASEREPEHNVLCRRGRTSTHLARRCGGRVMRHGHTRQICSGSRVRTCKPANFELGALRLVNNSRVRVQVLKLGVDS